MKQLFHPSILPSFHPVFKEDLDEATVYHNDQCEGLGISLVFVLRHAPMCTYRADFCKS
jgi:hypothetical protein